MNIVYEKVTNKKLDEAIKDLKKNLQKFDFGVLFELNFKDKFKESEIEYKDDFVVLEVCNPAYAKQVLDKNIHLGYVLPCKMVVRTEDEKTYIGMINPDKLIKLFEEPGLNELVEEVSNILKKAVDLSI